MLGLRAGVMMHYGPWLELLGFCWVFVRLLASLTEFIGHDLEVEPLRPPLVAVEPAYPHYSANWHLYSRSPHGPYGFHARKQAP